jgi:hypothetical protein
MIRFWATPVSGAVQNCTSKVETYTFVKKEDRWFIHLPKYLEAGWSIQDLEMVEGAHKLLNTVSNGLDRVTLKLSRDEFEGAEVLELMEHCAAPKGGAVYLLETIQRKQTSAFIWICDLALFIFGDLPEHIFFQRIRSKKA